MRPTATPLLLHLRNSRAARLHAARLAGRIASPAQLSRSTAQPFRTLFTRKTPLEKAKGRIWTLTGVVLGGLFFVYAYDSSAGIHKWLAIPVLHYFTKDDAEASHRFAIQVLSSGFAPVDTKPDQDVLAFDLFGHHFSNPVGLAAGFDKHGEAIDGLFKLGFSYVEIGSITPHPQPGNDKPRMFRLPSTESVINRYGFNSEGQIPVLARLKERIHAFLISNALSLPPAVFPPASVSGAPEPDPVDALLASRTDAQVIDELSIPRSLTMGKVLAINLGKNKVSTPESVEDYVSGVQRLGPYADVLVVNVSSPNTPGLRSLQRRDILQQLLSEVVKARNGLDVAKKPAVILKIAPDLSRQEVADIASAATDTKVDGIIVSNTTISRPASAGSGEMLPSRILISYRAKVMRNPDSAIKETGGLSGPPLKPLALRTLQYLYALTSGSIPLIGCGGISTGQDALDYARAGASFVQLYTALGYQGVGLPRAIKNEIATQLQADGKTWKQVVGSGVDMDRVKQPSKRIETEAESALKQLKDQIELAVYGKVAEVTEKVKEDANMPNSIPDWDDSPAEAAHATTTQATSSHSSSGFMTPGEPQIILIDRAPKGGRAAAWTREELQQEYERAKDSAKAALNDANDLSHDTAAAAKQAYQNMRQVGSEIKQDTTDVGRMVAGASKDAAAVLQEAGRHMKRDVSDASQTPSRLISGASKDAANTLRQAGQDIGEELRDVASDSAAATKQAADNFGKIGRDIRQDAEVASRVTADALKGPVETISQTGQDVGQKVADASSLVVQAAQDAADNFRKIGQEIRKDAQTFGQVVGQKGQKVGENAQQTAEEIRQAGAAATAERPSGGIWNLGSTFGMRGKVSANSKRLV